MQQIPVYAFTGFLDSGKTKFIQETLEDQNFNDGCKILLIVCEEGIEEYDPTRFYGQNVRQLVIENESDLTPELLAEYEKKHVIDRVVIEYNGKKKNNVHRLRIGKLYEKEGADDDDYEPVPFDIPTED